MNIAMVTLKRQGEESRIVNSTYVEEVRGFIDIIWAPNHVVFALEDRTIVAYSAERVFEVVTYLEDQQS